MTSSLDYCEVTKNIHSFYDYSYWGVVFPKCQFCGYIDKTRVTVQND